MFSLYIDFRRQAPNLPTVSFYNGRIVSFLSSTMVPGRSKSVDTGVVSR